MLSLSRPGRLRWVDIVSHGAVQVVECYGEEGLSFERVDDGQSFVGAAHLPTEASTTLYCGLWQQTQEAEQLDAKAAASRQVLQAIERPSCCDATLAMLASTPLGPLKSARDL